jgi:hypothetical protein
MTTDPPTMADRPTRTTYLLRMWLPDRPGALGSVASRVGSVGGDIVAVDVVDREGGQAVDDLVVELPADRLDLMLREVRAVDGVGVEEVHAIGQALPDLGLGVLRAAADLLTTRDEAAVGECLCVHVRQVVRLDWTAVCRTRTAATVATSGSGPPAQWLEAYAVGLRPLDEPPAPFTGGAGSTGGSIAGDRPGEAERQIAVASIAGFSLLLMGGREGLSIRPRERSLLEALATVAAARLSDLVTDDDLAVH